MEPTELPTVPSVSDLFNRDPCVCLPAAQSLIAGGSEFLPSLIGQINTSLSLVSTFAIRQVLRAFPQESGPLVIDRALHGEWHDAIATACCFDISHTRYCKDHLIEAFQATNDKHIGWVCLEALGRLDMFGCTSVIGDHLEVDDSEYRYCGYAHGVLKAFARFFVKAGGETVHVNTSYDLEQSFSSFSRAVTQVIRREGFTWADSNKRNDQPYRQHPNGMRASPCGFSTPGSIGATAAGP